MSAIMRFEGVANIPFQELRDDPLLVLRNLPKVSSITKVDELDYLVITKPYSFHAGLTVVGRSHVTLEVQSDKIIWKKSPHIDHEMCNGEIEGEASDIGNGQILLKGNITLDHPFLTRWSWPFVKTLTEKTGEALIKEFVDNFHDPVFENDVPE